MRTLVVSGAIANKPHHGGEAWVRLSWAEGLRRLGFNVYLLEQIAPEACVDETGTRAAFEASINRAYFRDVVRRFGFANHSALLYGEGDAGEGMNRRQALDLARSAELLVNISGHIPQGPLLRAFGRKAYVDIDPGYTQFWHADGTLPLTAHDTYFTIGQNVGAADCAIPTCGLEWRAVRQPVVLDQWPVTGGPKSRRFTTVASWRGSYGRVQSGGRTYGLKAHEFRKVIELPRRVSADLEIALDIHPADSLDAEALRASGWRLADPRPASRDPDAFRRYIQGSSAEFSVAQGVYVKTISGWFSDRTVRYLAIGKPALVQETGFSSHFGTGVGLVPFQTFDDAAAGVEQICADYDAHSAAARALAESVFAHDRVLPRFLQEAGVAP